MTRTVRPLILFSPPRSGSTLLQRMLAAHSRIAATAEPWLLIPQLYAFRREGVAAEYRHKSMVGAVEDFCEELPQKRETYFRHLRRFILSLYGEAADDEAVYFIDKTPRYALVAEDVLSLFPEGKFLFLWRNPLAVAASMSRTWYDGKWRLRSRRADLVEAPLNLARTFRSAGERALAVRFEDLLGDTQSQLRRICEYLELDFEPRMIEQFADIRFRGRMGDPTGTARYTGVSTEPLTKWKKSYCNPLRKRWGRKYLARIGRDALAEMGYDADELRAELDAVPAEMRRLAGDALECVRDVLRIDKPARRMRVGREGPTHA